MKFRQRILYVVVLGFRGGVSFRICHRLMFRDHFLFSHVIRILRSVYAFVHSAFRIFYFHKFVGVMICWLVAFGLCGV